MILGYKRKTSLLVLFFENFSDHYLTNYSKKQHIKIANASTQTVKVSSRLLGTNDGIFRPIDSREKKSEIQGKVQRIMNEIESCVFSDTNMQ